MTTLCTWVGCSKLAAHPQVREGGQVWARLCDEHHQELEEAVQKGSPGRLLSCWVKANGGAKKLSEKM